MSHVVVLSWIRWQWTSVSATSGVMADSEWEHVEQSRRRSRVGQSQPPEVAPVPPEPKPPIVNLDNLLRRGESGTTLAPRQFSGERSAFATWRKEFENSLIPYGLHVYL